MPWQTLFTASCVPLGLHYLASNQSCHLHWPVVVVASLAASTQFKKSCLSLGLSCIQPGMVTQVYNPSIWEDESGGLRIQGQSGPIMCFRQVWTAQWITFWKTKQQDKTKQTKPLPCVFLKRTPNASVSFYYDITVKLVVLQPMENSLYHNRNFLWSNKGPLHGGH